MPLPRLRLLVPAALAAVLTGSLTGALGTAAHAERPDPGTRPRLLAHPSHGRTALAALGDRLATAAAGNQMSSARLSSVLSADPTAWVARDGSLFYVDQAAGTAGAASVPAATTAAAAAPYTLAQTFALHSLPGSNHTIYLDFDGYSLPSSSFWVGQQSMTTGAFDGWSMDASPAFSSAEQAFIQKVWRIVADKFAPFDVDVTTQDPGAAAYNRSGAADQTYGDHVVLTDDPDAVNQACGGSCSGVAVVGGFDATNDSTSALEPAWVFTSKTYDKPALVAHTAAHEIGHTLGLDHDGVTGGSSYYGGQGNWFPIMGSGVNAVGQWSNGDYKLADNLQDDLAVIAGNASPTMLRTDDHGNLPGSATDLGSFASYDADGVISTRTDQDFFAVHHDCAGPLSATATGVGEGQAVDLQVRVLGDLGLTLASNDPASSQDDSWPHLPIGLDATATVTDATAGIYYVAVDGVGRGSAFSDGYSDYGSVGGYHLAVTGCADAPVPVPPPTTPTTPTTTPPTGPVVTVHAPSAPRIGRAVSGRRGHPVNASARWSAPVSTGGAAITGYRVRALRLTASGRVLRTTSSRVLGASTRSFTMKLASGRYRFQVIAVNRIGSSAASASSSVVRAR